MFPLVRFDPREVRHRLAEVFGLEAEVFETAVRTGHVALLQCTDNDPPFIPGTNAWARTLRALREQILGPDWRKDDAGNYSLTINDSRRVNIVVSSGDQMTGLAHAEPKTRAPKGEKTRNVVDVNRQGDLFPETIERRSIAPGIYDTWVLLIYIKSEEVRAEISRPVEMEDGQIIEWSERIILPITAASDSDLAVAPDDFGPDFDPAVQRIA